jgi:ribonuclease BN (tRNA processing enzyme)
MRVRVLGCSGGVGANLRTTSLLIDDDILLDAGTGVGDLSLDAMRQIRHIFLTHSHLDHTAYIPLLVDSVFGTTQIPLTVHAQAVTLKALREHIFNNVIWPDFSRLPTVNDPVMRYQEMSPGEIRDMSGRRLEMITVNHVVPGVGYRLEAGGRALAFSGDTSTNDNFWNVLNSRPPTDVLIVEAAFANKDSGLARVAGHYCPDLLAADLAKLNRSTDVYISHNKPGDEQIIFAECQAAIGSHRVHRLTGGEEFTL